MTKQLIIGMICEGSTDYRFLNSIIKRTFEDVILEYTTDVEILGMQKIESPGDTFVNQIFNASNFGHNKLGIQILCIHTDADDENDENAFNYKINPAISHLKANTEDICKIIVPIVPVREMETWLLADKICFLEEIGTNDDVGIGLNIKIETISNPKEFIQNAISTVYKSKPKRRRRPSISEIYLPIGQRCNLNYLKQLTSYSKFRGSVKDSLIELNYINFE